MEKKKIVKHYLKLSAKLKLALKKAYPKGFFGNVMVIERSKNKRLFCVTLETDQAKYLIKLDEWQCDKKKKYHPVKGYDNSESSDGFHRAA